MGALLLAAVCEADTSATITLHASANGAHLDSNLLTGGGTDDTMAMQRLLDTAADGKSVQLIIDGPALVGGLNVYGNTTIECTVGGGLYLKDGASRAILRNVHRSRGSILDEHIEVRGCFLNGNRPNQPSANIRRADLPTYTGPSNKESDGTYISGLQFLGVNHLSIHDVTLWNVRAFGALIANASDVDIRNVVIDHGAGPEADITQIVNTDGLHFKGPLRFVSIESIKVRVADDAIAFNPNDYDTNDVTTRNDFGPYVGQGPITDVVVHNLQLMDTTNGIRVLSTNERIDRIVIDNVTGTLSPYYLLTIGHLRNPADFGNIGRITLSNVSVDRPGVAPVKPEVRARARENRLWYGEGNGGEMPLINVNGHIEVLQISGLSTRVQDERPLLRLGPEAKVGLMSVELVAHDPALTGRILKLDQGAYVEQLNFALSWQGLMPDSCRSPIIDEGGIVVHLRWINAWSCKK